MQKFIGEDCPVCGKEFHEGDDIVVCPVCGTPHHRDCYKVENKCANQDYHKEKKEWQPTKIEQSNHSNQNQICPNCKGINPQSTEKCLVCGYDFKDVNNKTTQNQGAEQVPRIGSIDDIKINGLGIQNFHIYLRINQKYFVSKWKQHENDNFFMSFNWSAFIFSFIYYFYRKMYRLGSIVLLLIILSMIPAFSLSFKVMPQIMEYLPQIMVNPQIISSINIDFTGYETQVALANVCAKLPFIISLGGSLVANYFYRKKALKDITKITSENTSTKETNLKLYLKGGVSVGNAVSIILFVFVAYFIVINTISFGLL